MKLKQIFLTMILGLCLGATSIAQTTCPSPSLSKDGGGTACQDGTLTVVGELTGSTYVWSTGATTKSIVLITGTNSYSVTVTGTLSNGAICSKILSASFPAKPPVLQLLPFGENRGGSAEFQRRSPDV